MGNSYISQVISGVPHPLMNIRVVRGWFWKKVQKMSWCLGII